jgi:hypothetical protein
MSLRCSGGRGGQPTALGVPRDSVQMARVCQAIDMSRKRSAYEKIQAASGSDHRVLIATIRASLMLPSVLDGALRCGGPRKHQIDGAALAISTIAATPHGDFIRSPARKVDLSPGPNDAWQDLARLLKP